MDFKMRGPPLNPHGPDPIRLHPCRDHVSAPLVTWVRHCINAGVQDLDLMVVSAPVELKEAFDSYASMADAIEVAIARSWMEITLRRLQLLH